MTLAADLLRALDPVALAGQVGMVPDPWQARALASFAARQLYLVHRQGGKSATAGILAAHTALYRPGSTTLLVSPGLRQSQEVFRKVLHAYRTLSRPVLAEAENKLTLELENGSRVVSLPGTETTIRAFTADLIVIDEASRVDDEVFDALTPMVAVSGGRIVAMSTPAGARGWFYRAASDPAWERYIVRAEECPRITRAYLAAERERMGPYVFCQEYECAFVSLLEQPFATDLVMGAVTPDVRPLFGGGR